MSDGKMRTVRVPTGRAYDILIGEGLIRRAGTLAAGRIAPCRALIVVDDTVDGLYGAEVERSFREAGFATRLHVFPHGESHKTLATFAAILEDMADFGMARSDLTVALGGGVTGDVAGFAAACYARGTRVMQIPTTLLAAVDSSVGGKTAVNFSFAKNMAGAFWQPSLVVCDTAVLRALPGELFREGAAEVIKYGALADVELLTTTMRPDWADDLDAVVEKCVSIKRDVVLGDERDEGKRQLLNLGHTVGHAIEKLSGFAVPHGIAVAAGLMIEARAAFAWGVSEVDCAPAIECALRANKLPLSCEYGAGALAEAAMMDKKRHGSEIALPLPSVPGRAAIVEMPVARLSDFIAGGLRD